jgi:Domain of unknown function (DUF4281)
MSYELLFSIANAAVIPAWVLLIMAPKGRWTGYIAHSYLYPVLLGLFYLYLLVTTWGGEGGMDSIAAVQKGFSRDGVLLLGWVHYLVFDLFIGAWIVRDAQRNGILHMLIVPSLALTLLLGPVGLLIYLTIRWLHLRTFRF